MANKYPGWCKDCRAKVPAGHGELVKQPSGAWAVSCNGKGHVAKAKQDVHAAVAAGTLLNSPGRAALHGRNSKDFSVGEETGTRHCWAEDHKPGATDLGDTIRDKRIDGKGEEYLTLVGLSAHWVSQDEADDFDLIGTDGSFSKHWSVTGYYRPATPEEIAPVQAREAEAQQRRDAAVRAKQDLEQAGKDFDAKLAELTSGLIRCEARYSVLTGDGRGPFLLDWHDGSQYKQLKQVASKVTGAVAYVFPHGGYDDYRCDMFVDQATALEAFRLMREDYAKYKPQTPASAAEWLERYRGCVGTEYYEWLAQQPERN